MEARPAGTGGMLAHGQRPLLYGTAKPPRLHNPMGPLLPRPPRNQPSHNWTDGERVGEAMQPGPWKGAVRGQKPALAREQMVKGKLKRNAEKPIWLKAQVPRCKRPSVEVRRRCRVWPPALPQPRAVGHQPGHWMLENFKKGLQRSESGSWTVMVSPSRLPSGPPRMKYLRLMATHRLGFPGHHGDGAALRRSIFALLPMSLGSGGSVLMALRRSSLSARAAGLAGCGGNDVASQSGPASRHAACAWSQASW